MCSPARYPPGEWDFILLETSRSGIELAALSHLTQKTNALGRLHTSSCQSLVVGVGSKMSSSSKRKASGKGLRVLAAPRPPLPGKH